MNTAAVILAGGASRRMGQPKALLTFAGETFLDRLVGLFETICSQVIVVLGHNADKILAGITRQPSFVRNPDPERGQLSSLQCGFAALDQSIERLFFTPVDYPAVQGATIHALIEKHAQVVVPQYQGKHGHPVLISRSIADEILALGPGQIARDVIHRHIRETDYLDVDDPGILVDVDDPEAYRMLTQVAT